MPGFFSSGEGFCPIRWAGIHWCPGCGLGRSISAVMHFDLAASWQFHKLGFPALLIIWYRIYYLTIPTKPKLHAKLSDEPA
ncbi:DUF2752 domain-containing protein [Flavihumibacter solisilvae]|uniref:DUF2752 domain-containing protein n=1 Tax=Flavihumibacter solisilvae TaxID=1349421 RepID=UPI003B832211